MPVDLFDSAPKRCLAGILVLLAFSIIATPFGQSWANEARMRIDQEVSTVVKQVQGLEICSLRFDKIKKLEKILANPEDVKRLSYRSLVALFSIADTDKIGEIVQQRCFSYSIMSFLERAELNRRKLAPILKGKLAEYRMLAKKIRERDKEGSKAEIENTDPRTLLELVVQYNATVSQIDGEFRSLARAYCAISDIYPDRCAMREVRKLDNLP